MFGLEEAPLTVALLKLDIVREYSSFSGLERAHMSVGRENEVHRQVYLTRLDGESRYQRMTPRTAILMVPNQLVLDFRNGKIKLSVYSWY